MAHNSDRWRTDGLSDLVYGGVDHWNGSWVHHLKVTPERPEYISGHRNDAICSGCDRAQNTAGAAIRQPETTPYQPPNPTIALLRELGSTLKSTEMGAPRPRLKSAPPFHTDKSAEFGCFSIRSRAKIIDSIYTHGCTYFDHTGDTLYFPNRTMQPLQCKYGNVCYRLLLQIAFQTMLESGASIFYYLESDTHVCSMDVISGLSAYLSASDPMLITTGIGASG